MLSKSKSIYIFNNQLCLSFAFDPNIVAKVKEIDGRMWNKLGKRWEIPVENIIDTCNSLFPMGFSASEAVQKELLKQQKLIEEATQIKDNVDAEYKGTLPLMDFQRKGVAFMRRMPHCLLGDVPGLGKTLQVIAATENDPSILIFTMNTLKFSTANEIKKWIPDAKVLVIDGNKTLRREQWLLHANKNKYVVANYECLIHDYEHIKQKSWDTIVCDEATRICNPEAKTTLNLKTLSCKKRIAMSGTPISNSPVDIFSIIDWLVPRYLGHYYQFRKKYCVMGEYNRVIGFSNVKELSEKVERFMLRRTKEEVFKDFPPKTVENIVFPLSAHENQFYKNIKSQLIKEIKEMGGMDHRNLSIIPVKMLRLKQCTDSLELLEAKKVESTKLTVLKDLVENVVSSGEKAIIFTQFSSMLHILERELSMYRPLTVYGDVDNEERFKRVQEFNSDPLGRIMIMTEAGAYGLNMQSASYIFHYDAPWSIAKLQQREDRAHRYGQTKPVTVYNLIAKDTVDEYILKVLSRKNKTSVDILQDANRLEEQGLSKEDIEEILRL